MDQNRHSRTQNSCAWENPSREDCSGAEKNRGRNSSESLQPWGVVGFAWVETPKQSQVSIVAPLLRRGILFPVPPHKRHHPPSARNLAHLCTGNQCAL